MQEVAEAEDAKASTTSSAQKLTPSGAKLYQTVVAAVHVVEAALTGQTPSLDDLRKMRQEASRVEVIPKEVILGPGDKTTIQVSRGGPLTAFASSNEAVAMVRLVNGSAAEITAGQIKTDKDEATVSFANGRGGEATVSVTVAKKP